MEPGEDITNLVIPLKELQVSHLVAPQVLNDILPRQQIPQLVRLLIKLLQSLQD
jgi:hypothetical protein